MIRSTIRKLAPVAAALSTYACFAQELVEPGRREDPVTDQPERTNQPAIAFVSNRTGASYIYVADADGSNVARLTRGHSPAWSWDGRLIAFVREESVTGPWGIYVMNSDGSNPRSVADGLAPSWTPDGRIAYHSGIPWMPEEATAGGIWVMNADGTGKKLLLQHAWARPFNYVPGYGTESVQFPTWSPDGRTIAFWLYSGYMGERGLSLMDADGSNPRYLRNGVWTWGRPAWSPDGSRISAIAPMPFSFSIVSFTGGGTGAAETHYVSQSGRFPEEADWSPDGRSMVFSEGGRHPDTHRRIFILTLETGEVRQLIPSLSTLVLPPYDDWAPVWARGRR